jgi:DNA-binding NarL/FixJ family response regulator
MSPIYRQCLGAAGLDAFRLTPGQREVMRRVAAGYRHEEIADELGISLNAVRSRVARVLTRLNVRNATQAAVLLDRAGLL